MLINIEDEFGVNFDFDHEKILKTVCEKVLEKEGFSKDAEVDVLFTDSDSIREINLSNRGIDKETDVLSFPLLNFESPTKILDNEGEGNFNIDPENGLLMLGDIVLSIPRVKSQAKEYGHSELREFSFLICHSMLHLLGYDHILDSDRLLMEERQRIIMDALNIGRD